MPYDGENDFTDEELEYIIKRGHELGKIIDVHAGGGGNAGLRRMLAFDVDTLEHPFERYEIVDWDIIEGYVKKGVIIDTLLEVKVQKVELAADPHRFNETLYTMSLGPYEHRTLMQYRDKLLFNQRHPDQPGLRPYPAASTRQTDRSYNEQMKVIETAKENMRRFIKAGAKFWMGTDTGAFMTMRQEDSYAREMAQRSGRSGHAGPTGHDRGGETGGRDRGGRQPPRGYGRRYEAGLCRHHGGRPLQIRP